MNVFHQKFFIVSTGTGGAVYFIYTGLNVFACRLLFQPVIKFKIWTSAVPNRTVYKLVMDVICLSGCKFEIGDFEILYIWSYVFKRGTGGYLKGPPRRVFTVIAWGIV